MRNIRIIIGLAALTLFTTTNLYAVIVSAPLDGGLLSILGAAGVAYYIARRKKNS